MTESSHLDPASIAPRQAHSANAPVRARVVGYGSALPAQRVTNHQLSQELDTPEEWIVQRSGIRERRFAEAGEKTSDLAIAAAARALERAGMTGADIDLLIVATTTPDQTVPSTAVRVQAAIEMHRGVAFDVNAACSGFVFALSVADSMMQSGQARTALVIGAETLSRILDRTERSSCILFGDGAGAVILRAEPRDGSAGQRGLLSTHLHSDGRHRDKIRTDGGVSSTETVGKLRLDGPEVFLHAVINMTASVDEALAANDLSRDDIDWLIPHQANQRIVERVGEKLRISGDKVVLTVGHHGNTSAASIPLALDEAVADGRVKEGDVVVLAGMGAGFAWGSALLRW